MHTSNKKASVLLFPNTYWPENQVLRSSHVGVASSPAGLWTVRDGAGGAVGVLKGYEQELIVLLVGKGHGGKRSVIGLIYQRRR